MPKFGWIDAPSTLAMSLYLIMWGLFTLLMYIATLKNNKALQTIFLSLTILFFLLAIGDLTGSALIKLIAGIEGIFCGFSAIYLAMAEVINQYLGRTVLPIGAPKK